MAAIQFFTCQDMVDHLQGYLGSPNADAHAQRDIKRAILSAYRDLSSHHRWTYYYTPFLIATVAPQTTGTITYDHTGGLYERMVTLAGATWPSWVIFGELVIDNCAYQVAEQKSSTVITLSTNFNPGADVAALTTYTLYRDTYPMPLDFVAADMVQATNEIGGLSHVHPGSLTAYRAQSFQYGQPRNYTFIGSPDHYGATAIRFFPPPDALRRYQALYLRRPRPIKVFEYQAGKVSVTASSLTVTGVDTAWTANHVGTVLRTGSDSLNPPTGVFGGNPFIEERVVMSVESATSLTVDTIYTATASDLKYTISDPLDVEYGTMLTLLQRGAELELCLGRPKKDVDQARSNYNRQLIIAREADSKNMEQRVAFRSSFFPLRLSDMPLGDDIG